jgi:hypothetical protein
MVPDRLPDRPIPDAPEHHNPLATYGGFLSAYERGWAAAAQGRRAEGTNAAFDAGVAAYRLRARALWRASEALRGEA